MFDSPLSIYNDTLGDVTGLHDVHLRIDGSFASGNIFATGASRIEDRLWETGWYPLRVAISASIWGITSFTFNVFVKVGDQYDDETVVRNMVRDLAGVFNVTGISVVSSGPRGSSQPPSNNPPRNNPTPQPSGTPNAGLPAAANNTTAGGGDFLSNVGLGLGISTPVILLGAGVIALIVLRK